MSSPSESEIARIWQYQLLKGAGLATEEGEPMEIIYPGRINDDQGGDFRDVVIASRGRVIKGDVEIHVKSSDWRTHRHYQDAAYNRVILHVVQRHDSKQATTLQNGRSVPVLALGKYVEMPTDPRPSLPGSSASWRMPCLRAAQGLSIDSVAEVLDGAGEERFLAKTAGFQADLAQVGAGQSLYQGIMGALGYSKNKLSFLELARRLPLQILEAVSHGGLSDVECLARQQALLLGTAGLLPSQRLDRHQRNRLDDRWVEKLESVWGSSGYTEAMSPGRWRLFKVRPNNSPIRRLVAMSYLILRYRERGIFEELVSMVEETPLHQGSHRLEERLLVTTDGYWASHFDFGPGGRLRSPTLVGNRRAADIIVNVLLPFSFAWSQFSSQPGLMRKAFDLYGHYPRLAVNAVERHMKEQLGLSSRLVNSARRQQGLLHIYNTRCTQGGCSSCPLSKPKAENHV